MGTPGTGDEVWLNDGGGGLAPAPGRLPPMGGWTTGSALGDVDLDGDLDLVTTQRNVQSLRAPSVLVNDGSGSFREAVGANESPWLPPDMEQVLLLDLDRDGDLDVWGSWTGWIVNPSTCAGFFNLHRQQWGPRTVARGTPFDLTVDGQVGHGFVLAFGLSRTGIELPGLGHWALDPTGLAVLPPVVIPAGRRSRLRLTAPGHPSAVGREIYSQAVDLAPGTLQGARSTNWWAMRVQ